MSASHLLKESLYRINSEFAAFKFRDSKSMENAVKKLEKMFGLGRAPDPERVTGVLRKFFESGDIKEYQDIKTVCYGILNDIQGKKLVDDAENLALLLKRVDEYQIDAKKLVRCFPGVMSAFFSVEDEAGKRHQSRVMIRESLSKWLVSLEELGSQPEWLKIILEHKNLFGENPTVRYGASILDGKSAEFENLTAQLEIPFNSWIRRQVIISAIDAATGKSDQDFTAHLDLAINLLKDNSSVLEEGAIKILNRYSQLSMVVESVPLRIFALEVFGNPLITADKARWHRVSREALEMVSNWLKGYLIERFFDLLNVDGRTDIRRTKFWLRYKESMVSIWFVLGSAAMNNDRPDFKKLRQLMGNQCLVLDGASGNNAFIMQMGKIFAVEFSENGNAAYFFDQKKVKFDLSSNRIDRSILRDDDNLERLLHKDGLEIWEKKFSSIMMSKYGLIPMERPAKKKAAITLSTVDANPIDLKQFCNSRGIVYNENLPGIGFVVYTGIGNSAISDKLGLLGLKFDQELGLWVKNK